MAIPQKTKEEASCTTILQTLIKELGFYSSSNTHLLLYRILR